MAWATATVQVRVDLSDTRVEGEDTPHKVASLRVSGIRAGERAGTVNLIYFTDRAVALLGKSINTSPQAPLCATPSPCASSRSSGSGSTFSFFSFSLLFLSLSLSPHFHDSLVTTPTTMMFTPTHSATDIALLVLRVISPSIVLLTTISLLTARPTLSLPPSPITPVTVATRVPRHGLILSCLTFSSFIYLFDGLAFTIYAVINKYWPQCTGIEINALIGLVAFSGLAALGSWKEVHGVDVWLLRRLRISFFLSIVLDATQVALYGTSMPKDRTSIV